MLDYQIVKNWDFGDKVQSYTFRDTILYALGLGIGTDPVDATQLRFVFEKDLQVIPTMAAVLGSTGFWWKDPSTGVDWVKLVYSAQDLRIHRPLPIEGTVIGRNHVVSVTDRGVDKGAIVQIRRELFEQSGNHLLAEVIQTSILRGDGGYSTLPGAQSDPAPTPLANLPDRAPDLTFTYSVPAQSALIYRLSGDYNTLHADPDVAARAGFKRPILHGLCTFGIAAYTAICLCCSGDGAALKRIAARFTAPVYPGEDLMFSIWKEGAKSFRLRAQVHRPEPLSVLDNGIIEVA